MVAPENLVNAFEGACNAGSSAVASVIYRSCDPTPVSTPQLVRQTRAAAEYGHKDLLQFLLSKCAELGLKEHVNNMIYLAAGDGKLEIMAVLLSWAATRQLASQTVLDAALVVGAKNGHEKVCAHLISRGASPVHAVSLPRRFDVAIRGWRVRVPQKVRKTRDSPYQAPSSSESESENDNDGGLRSARRFVASDPEAVEHDAVQFCLAGYERFQRDGYRYHGDFGPGSPWHVQDEAAQTRTLRTLLEGIVSFDERHWSHKACTAAKFCPPNVLEILLQKGVSARSVVSYEDALQFAASRERWNHSTMQLLLQAGADQDLEDSDLRRLLASSLAQFDDSSWLSALFPAVQSLDELFETGCGAVVEHLLSRLPLEDASGNGYAVLLQTAAAADRLELVKLLIARNIDVNAIGSRYGTALQAACRFAHTGVAEALLQAGADPNIIQGKYCTALRAAVVKESLPTVLLLLQFHADTELTGARFDFGGDLQPTALYLAVQEGRTAIALALLDAGARIENAQHVESLLVSACSWGECSVVRRLIEAGADLQATCTGRRNGITHTSAMHAAISCAHHGVVQLLLSCGFDLTAAFPVIPDADDPDNPNNPDSPDDLLTFAVHRGNIAIITTLLQDLPRGCDTDTMLLRASEAAIEHNFVTILVQLLDAAWDAKSVPVLVHLSKLACRTPHESIVELLFDHFSTLDDEPDLSSALATIDVREVRGELFESWLCYAPYTVELFVEVCIRGDFDLVQRGIDLGYRPDSEDEWTRSPLHLAAAQGRTLVVERLLETGADVNRVHATYGTALVTALEGLSADKLTQKSTEADSLYAAELAELDHFGCSDVFYADSPMRSWHPAKRSVPFMTPRIFRASTTEYAKTVSLLLSKGARADCSPGRFGTALSLAAFAGLDETFDLLLLHGAEIHGAGGILGSPLSAAIDQGHMNIVDRLLNTAKRSEFLPGPGVTDFHRACEVSNLSIVGKLLDLGHKPGTEDSSGRTALKISLDRDELKDLWKAPTEDQARLVHMLMDADTRPILSADELVAVTEIRDPRFQSALMDSILASMEQHKIPEASFLRLLHTRDNGIIRQILDKNAVTAVTTAMLVSAHDEYTMSLLLEYDPSFIVTSATIDAVQNGHKNNASFVKVLLLRDSSLRPTESQMCRALATEDSYIPDPWLKRNEPRLLDLMFSRNSDLSVTHEMLEEVRNPDDLRILLAHLKPGKHVVTDRVLKALHPPGDYNEHDERKYSEELLQIFLDFEPSAKVSSEIAQQFLKNCELDTVERLLDHDNSIVIHSENISYMICSQKIYSDDGHRRLVKILTKHPGQYEMTKEVKAAVDSRFRQHSEKPLKDMYYTFAGWTDTKEHSRGANEGSQTDKHQV